MKISSWIVLLCAFSALPVYALDTNTKTKDCWMHIVTAEPDATGKPVIAYRESDATRKRLHSNTQKSGCLDNNKGKGEACDAMLKGCANNKQTPKGTMGVVGAWVQWGTSLEDCPALCPGFSNVSPKAYHH